MYWLSLCWVLFKYEYRLSWKHIVLSCAMMLYQTLEFFQWLLIFALWSPNFWMTEHNSDCSMLYYYNALLKWGFLLLAIMLALIIYASIFLLCVGFRNISKRWFFLLKWYNLKSIKNTSLIYQSKIREQYQEDKGELEGKTDGT